MERERRGKHRRNGQDQLDGHQARDRVMIEDDAAPDAEDDVRDDVRDA